MNIDSIQHINRASIAIAEKHGLELDDSLRLLNEAELWLVAGKDIATSIPLQSAYLTAINAGKRTFLKGIKCVIGKDIPNLLPIRANSFNDLIKMYGGQIQTEKPGDTDLKLTFGKPAIDVNSFEIICNGWQAGVNVFNDRRIELSSSNTNATIGGIAAAALGLFYMFNRKFGIIDHFHELSSGVSLWDLGVDEKWYKPEYEGPGEINYPKQIWCVGLGHLGQAYLWTLGLMYKNHCLIALQDGDTIDEENLGSQVLCSKDDIGLPKARVCSQFLTSIGFQTQIIEKPFVKEDQYHDWSTAYRILLNGVDNVKTRRIIDPSCFDVSLDGGTNGKLELFDSFTMKNLGLQDKKPAEIWEETIGNEVLHKNLYARTEKEHGCGQLINIGISTPFVGLFSAAIIVSELLRSINKGKAYSSVSVQMRDLFSIRAINKYSYNERYINLAS